jgi:hypothetical protein
MSQDLRKAKDDVLKQIGKNILLFQSVEFSMKKLAPVIDLRKAEHAFDDLEKRLNWFQGKPLGTLVSSLKNCMESHEDNQAFWNRSSRPIFNRVRLVIDQNAQRMMPSSGSAMPLRKVRRTLLTWICAPILTR